MDRSVCEALAKYRKNRDEIIDMVGERSIVYMDVHLFDEALTKYRNNRDEIRSMYAREREKY